MNAIKEKLNQMCGGKREKEFGKKHDIINNKQDSE